ncbi:hypothetical protein ACOMHN_024468 [Nucella lapillus]
MYENKRGCLPRGTGTSRRVAAMEQRDDASPLSQRHGTPPQPPTTAGHGANMCNESFQTTSQECAAGRCQEIVQSDGSPKIKTFRIPSISQGSIYHEPVSLSTLVLTESALNRYNRSSEEWRGGPYPHYESINGQNRQAVLSQLLQVFNVDIAQLAPHSHEALCLIASKISTTGLPSLQVSPSQLQSWPNTNGPRPKPAASSRNCPRMTVSPVLLVEMLWAVNFAMYNGCDKVARDAVRDVHARACFELLADVQMVTEAILNSASLGVGGMGDGGPMGISMASVPTHTALAKSTITNASFKTKKLPDDIPMAEVDPQEPQAHSSKLSPIEEEHKGPAKQVLRLSKGRKKEEKEKQRGRDGRKDSDASSIKSLVLNGDGVDSVTVSVVRNQAKVTVDTVELRQLSKRYSEDHPLTNCNNSAVVSRRKSAERGGVVGGDGDVPPPRSRPNSFHGTLVNPESISTDL